MTTTCSTYYNHYGQPDLNTTSGALTHRYYVRDYLGSTRAVIDEDGNVLQSTAYYPSGVPLTPNSLTPQTIKLHTGKDFFDLQGAGWYDNQARYYDCLIPTFKSIDPLAETTPWNSPYVHCSNNPLNRVDPTGLADYYSSFNAKYLGTDNESATMGEYRLIDDEFYKQNNNKIASLTSNSKIITINTETISSNIIAVKNLSSQNNIEYQAIIHLDLNSGEISSTMGKSGNNGDCEISYFPGNSRGVMYVDNNETPRTKIIIGQVHGHPSSKTKGFNTKSEVSDIDNAVAAELQIPIYAIDAMANSINSYIHLSHPNNDLSKNKLSKDINQYNFGLNSLLIWGKSNIPTFK